MRRALLAALAVLAAVPAASQPPPPPPDMALLAAARVEFPERLGNFTRTEIVGVAPGAIGATYRLPQRTPGAPVVYILVRRPVLRPDEEELARNEAIARQFGSNVAVVRELPAPRAAPGARGRLWRVETDSFPLLTGAMVWQRDGWRIIVRGTVAADAADVGEAGWAEVTRLIDAFDWGGTGVTSAPQEP